MICYKLASRRKLIFFITIIFIQSILLGAKAELNAIDSAYLAGFFDAGGAIMASIEKHTEKKYGYRVRLVIKITQKHKEILDEIQKQLGNVHVRVNRDEFEFDIKDQNDIGDFIDIVYPYSKTKRGQFDIARKIAIQAKNVSSIEDLIRVAQLADELAALTVRSKGIRKNYASMLITEAKS